MINPEYPQAERLQRLDSFEDEGLWDNFVENFSPLIRRAIKERISRTFLPVNESEVDDIHQQVFVQLWRNKSLPSLKNPNSIPAYIVITAQNAAVDFIRKKRTAAGYSAKGLDEDLIAKTPNPRTETHNRQLYETVEDLVGELPLKECRIMTLALFYDLKHREISKLLDIPLNTVSTIIYRIKESLREKLKKRGYYV